MEYSPGNAIPYMSRVDAGTVEAVRQLGIDVVSSGDLVQRFEAIWTRRGLATHRAASERLYRIKDRAFELVARRASAGRRVDRIRRPAGDGRLVHGRRARHRLRRRSSRPRRMPATRTTSRPRPTHRAIGRRRSRAARPVGQAAEPGAVFADITWVGFTGRPCRTDMRRRSPPHATAATRRSRWCRAPSRAGREIRGFEVDRACRDVIEQAGFGAQFIHRTGHSLGEEVHGNGVHMDDYETHDDRRLIPGTGFTIEPGIYTAEFGVRTEINMFVGERDADVTGPLPEGARYAGCKL